MADTKISGLTAGAPAVGTDRIPVARSPFGSGDNAYLTVAGILTNDAHAGYSDYSAISNPSAPAADTGRFWARNIAGRVLPKWAGPSGVDYCLQPAFFGNQVQLVTPATGTTAGSFTGGSLTSAGTVSHPTPTSTSRATAMARIRHANVVTTTNQVLGFHGGSADMAKYWRGNAAGLGGFFMFARFSTALWAANTVRLFVGLRSGTTAVVASDTLAGHICGFFHDTTMGGTALDFVTRDGTTATRASISSMPTFAADVGFDAYIYCAPNGSTIFYRLDRIDTGATIVDSSATVNLPGSATFLAPECAMSNGTANTTVTTVAIATNRIYLESDY